MHTWGHHVTRPLAELCELYSVSSPRTWLEWVYDGQLTSRRTNVKTALLKCNLACFCRDARGVGRFALVFVGTLGTLLGRCRDAVGTRLGTRVKM